MHEGHRSRMYEKLKNGDGLYEHELLEILLFNAFPRKNTNPVAHSLLKTFGTINGVLSAEVDELCTVEGVGESVALYLKCIGMCVLKQNKPKSAAVAVLKSYEDFQDFVRLRFRGKTEEVLELYCLEKNGQIKKIFTYSTNESSQVEVDTDRVSKAIATTKPYGMLIAHNHLSGNSKPSANDDDFTAAVQLLCSINNVNLHDHCIYAGEGNVYSYFLSGKIDEIKRNFSYQKLVALGKNKNK
ncbi:MAG: hypothetical protein K2I20_02790 [Clostridia bacterium]|nr:hypothetical protein [Clostridia bacterium]MDE6356465.1 hypothetical protein [Clostridia bacterium]MDE7214259.1 hypothetical protein [Clostridia bacterium]